VPSPPVTVVIPVFNGAPWVADAIHSVLAQPVSLCRVVVVDDGSTDNTPEVLATFGDRIEVVRQSNGGLSAARNTGIRRSASELLIFLDADDLLPPGYIEPFVAAASDAPDADVFHCGWRGTDLEGRALYATDDPLPLDADPFHALLSTGSPGITSLCVRRRAVDRTGWFDETLAMQEDWDYWLRLAVGGATFRGVHAPPFIVRRRASSMSGSAGSRLALTGLSVVERHFAAHRPCPQCADTRRLDEWRRAALRSAVRDLASRVPVPGRLGRWMGTVLAVLRTPRLGPTAWRELRARATTESRGVE
jgi:glycosyltransferase involved in cell wall biosynthesis